MASGKRGSIPYTTCATVDSPERRVVDLSRAGFPEIPVLGRSAADRTYEGVEFHRHAGCMEITLCTRGSVKFDCEGRVYSLLPGGMFASRPEDAHRQRLNPHGTHLYWFFLKMPKKGETLFDLPPEESAALADAFASIPKRSFSAPEDARALFERLFEAYDGAEGAMRTLELRTALVGLALAVVRAGHRKPSGPRDDGLMAIVDRMRRSPERDFAMDGLVEETRLSPNTIVSRFRRLTGLPPHAFLVKCRIRKAMEILERGEEGIVEIAARLGFASSQHFATRFRQETGRTPSAWRDVHKNAK